MIATCVMFLDCPAYLTAHGTVRCGLPAEVLCRYRVTSTDGPLESAKIRCPRGHWFSGPVESLTWSKHLNPPHAGQPLDFRRVACGYASGSP